MAVFFYLVIVAIAFLSAFATGIYANPHKNIILETTLPEDKLNDPQVLALRKKFKKRLLQMGFLFSIISLPMLLIPYDSILLLLFLVLLFGYLGATYYLQITYIRKMTALKIQNGWELPTKPLLVDTKLIITKNQQMLSLGWFLPAILVTAVSGYFSLQVLTNSLAFLLITIFILLIFIGGYYVIFHLPVKPLTSDSTINQQFNDLMRHHWSVLLALSAFVLSPISFLPALTMVLPYEQAMYLVLAYFILLFAYVTFIFYYLFTMRKKQDHLILQATDYRYSGDDQYWRYGIYINPNDQRLMVPDRVGMNLSINLGRPMGKIIMALTGILLVGVLIFATFPLFLNDFSNQTFAAEVTDKKVNLSAPLTETRTIPIAEIHSVTLINKLPNKRIRVMGTATQHYLTGEFTVDGQDAYLLVYTDSQPILEIKTTDKTYYFSSKKANLTKQAYTEIEKQLP